MMVYNALVQLRDCLMDLFEVPTTGRGLLQAVYLLETLRRLLEQGNTTMQMHGLFDIGIDLIVGLIERFGYAFSAGVKLLDSLNGLDRELVLRSLEEIFEIMCFQRSFESPVVLCAAYIALLKAQQSPQEMTKGNRPQRTNSCFVQLVSTLNSIGYDLVLQEMLAAGREEICALEALRTALDCCLDGFIPFCKH